MSHSEWYYAHDNQQFGPVGSAELRQLAASGSLTPEDLLWRDGMDDWVAARNLKGLFPEEASEADPQSEITESQIPEMPSAAPAIPGSEASATPLGRLRRRHARQRSGRRLFDVLLDLVRDQVPARLVDSIAEVCVSVGHYGLYVAMAACALVSIMLGVKANSLNLILMGAIAVAILAVLQYVAARFCTALDRLNRTTGTNISSTAFPDCFALLAVAIGLAALLAAVVVAIQSEAYSLILVGLVAFVVAEYLAIVALHPESLSITIVPHTRAGEEAIGVISFLLKTGLRLVPVAFGTGVAFGTLRVLFTGYQMFTDAGPTVAQISAVDATLSIVYFAALPFLAYLTFLLYYLSVDVIRAILALPGKLDKLAEKDEVGSPLKEAVSRHESM